MRPLDLWPPLAHIRSMLEGPPVRRPAAGPAREGEPAAAEAGAPTDLLLPLTELARRREALAARGFGARWAPGRLLSVLCEGRMLGVLLDRLLPDGRWQGWLAVGEADWAGAWDVLLEPQDEPFEPLFGVVQAWNPVTLVPSPQLCARVLGELSATRLAAVRAVADEWAAQRVGAPAGTVQATPAAPGQIALRSVAGCFTVLTGTPLAAEGDPRADYQGLYQQAARRLAQSATPMARTAGAPLRGAAQSMHGSGRGGAGQRHGEDDGGPLRRFFRRLGGGAGGFRGTWGPALGVLALVLVVQNAGLLPALHGGDDDAMRLRDAPPTAPAAPQVDARVRWKPGTDMADAARLLQTAGAQAVAGPDGQGRWSLRLLQPQDGLAVLRSSPLVDAVELP
ncbi:hypothetical protein [uncultured Pseudacidovorax sp.]|uniref:hypothetical protein n=1 Tax=uncultured Pseudacidovorax sp. TaxID=679313 RepID=UPI0025D7CB58|nr:hypothetical protein [uncultured Pseudacidovorax sp.]